ncbi:MAG: glycerate kinase type-2 family protein [Anaerolineae bacterium]
MTAHPVNWGQSLTYEQRQFLADMIRSALQAVDPYQAVLRHLQRQDDLLRAGERVYDLRRYRRVLVVGAGKAGAPMAAAVHHLLGDRIEWGWVNVKRGYLLPDQEAGGCIGAIILHEAGHPIPNAGGMRGAEAILEHLQGLDKDTLVICLISGGGSALLPLPAEGITLEEKQQVTDALLASGATIHEFNAVRKHISRIKGGRLAGAAYPAQVIALILSDVVGNPLDVIASGPTSPDPSTWGDAWRVLEKYGLLEKIPAGVRRRLERGLAGELPDTPKPGDPVFEQVQNIIVGDNRQAALAALEYARQAGVNALLLTTFAEGEAREVGRLAAGIAKGLARHADPLPRPACVIMGGETTVTLRGAGKGGRNQELALSAAIALDGWENAVVLSLATDGTDGPTDAAGALAAGDTLERACRLGLDAQRYLDNNDAYHFFQALGDLIILGPTNTNVNDLIFVCAW